MSISPIGQSGLASMAPPAALSRDGVRSGGLFANVMHEVLSRANALEGEANQAVQNLATGKTDSIHNVMLSVAKADLTFRFLLEVRNRLTESLQEILRMQV